MGKPITFGNVGFDKAAKIYANEAEAYGIVLLKLKAVLAGMREPGEMSEGEERDRRY